MPAKVQLTGGAFQDSEGNVLANGTLIFQLSQDASVSGVGNIVSGTEITILLDVNGNVDTSTPQLIWGNDQMLPLNTYYRVTGKSASGQFAWGPNNQQVVGVGTFNVGTWVPNQVVSWNPPLNTSIALQHNGVNNGSQSKLNLVAGSGISVTDDGAGDVTLAATGGGSGSLGFSSVLQSTPLTVNLSTEGSYDWMYLGGFTGASLFGNMVEGNSVFKAHSKMLNGRLLQNMRFVLNPQIADGTTPLANFTFNSTSGDDASFNESIGSIPLVNRQGGFFFNNNSNSAFFPFGFQWREMPLNAVRTLKFYVYINNCTATFTARLSDGSAPDASIALTNGSTGEYLVTLNVTPGSSGAVLSVSFLCTSFNTSASSVGVEAVTMA